MKNVYKAILFLLFFSFQTIIIFAQKIDFPESFYNVLEKSGIAFITPLESGYKDFSPHFNEFAKYDFGIRSRREQLEIRYSIKPYDENDVMSMNPHLLTMRAVTSVASNEEDYIITALEMDINDLQNDFNADWGMTYFFTPKNKFSDRPFCRMIALYKEGKGTAFIFYLFKDAKNEALDRRYFALEFEREG